jgi:hypothetical protein
MGGSSGQERPGLTKKPRKIAIPQTNKEGGGLIDDLFPERRPAVWLLTQLLKPSRTLTVDPRGQG